VEIVGSEVYEAENPRAIKEARDFSHVRFTIINSAINLYRTMI